VATATDGTRFEARPIATGLDTPTSLAFAPDGRLFIAERPGRVRVVDRGQLRRAPALTLDDVSVGDGAGLLGLTLDPAFADNGFVYLFYTRARSGAPPAQRVVRYREVANVLSQPVVLLDDLPAGHDRGGGGLRVGPDGLLYVSVGDGGVADAAQDLASYAGKILRVRRDGTTPRGNPFMSPIYAVGYRNPLGLAWHPSTGELWATDRGRPGTAGGDEVNLVRAGANHGWPMAEGLATRPGMERPALLLSASPGPAGLAFYDAEAIPGFRNDLFLAAQTGAHLLRVRFDPREPRRIIATERLLDGRFGRLRDVIIGPDGALYVATGNGSPDAPDGQIIRLGPP
jgi:glucose/arabinose dehydrogenase